MPALIISKYLVLVLEGLSDSSPVRAKPHHPVQENKLRAALRTGDLVVEVLKKAHVRYCLRKPEYISRDAAEKIKLYLPSLWKHSAKSRGYKKTGSTPMRTGSSKHFKKAASKLTSSA